MYNITGQDDSLHTFGANPSLIKPDLPPITKRGPATFYTAARDYQTAGGIVVPPVTPTGGISRPFMPANETIVRPSPYGTTRPSVSYACPVCDFFKTNFKYMLIGLAIGAVAFLAVKAVKK